MQLQKNQSLELNLNFIKNNISVKFVSALKFKLVFTANDSFCSDQRLIQIFELARIRFKFLNSEIPFLELSCYVDGKS